MKKSLKATGIACFAAAGLVSSWDVNTVQGAQYNFSGEITPTQDLSDVYFLFSIGTCSPGGGIFAQKISGYLSANTTHAFNISMQSIPDGLGSGSGYAIVALYDVTNGGVSLSYGSTWAANTLAVSPAPSWDFNGLPASNNGVDVGYFVGFPAESEVAAVLSAGVVNGVPMTDAKTDGPFGPTGSPFPSVSTDPLNPSTFTMVNFSAASNGGSGFVVESVPEPATISLLVAGVGVLFFSRSRKPKTG